MSINHAEPLEERRRQVDKDIVSLKQTVDSLQTSTHSLELELVNLRSELHSLSDTVNKIENSLESIAEAMMSMSTQVGLLVGKMGDLPETWQKVKGFWSVATWLKDNIVILAVLIGVIFITTGALAFA